MKLPGKLPLLAACLFGTASLHAAVVTWQTPVTLAGSDDVNTQGSQVFGRCINTAFGTTATIVNGVDFGYNSPNWSVTYAEDSFSSEYAPNITGMTGSDAADYSTVLGRSRVKSSGTSVTFTLGNLAINQQYLFQFFVADYRNFPNQRTETIRAGVGDIDIPTLKYLDSGLANITAGSSSQTAAAAHGQYVIGTFTADSTSVTFTLNGNETVDYTAMQLRAVPEPATYGLLGAGTLAGVAFVRRRRNNATRAR